MKRAWITLLLVALAAPVAAVPIVSEGLVAYYPFDGNANDASGNGHNGTSVGGVTFVPGVSGSVAHFDGTTGYVRVSDTSIGNLGANATLAFWFKAEPSDFAPGGHRIFEKDDREYYSFIASTGGLGVYVRGTNSYGPPEGTFILSDTQDMIDSWIAIVLRKTGGTFDLFKDGELFGSVTTAISSIVTSAPANFGDSFFWSARGDPQYFAGLIDDVRIYDRALTAAEIRQLASVGEVPEPSAVLLLSIGLFAGAFSRTSRRHASPRR